MSTPQEIAQWLMDEITARGRNRSYQRRLVPRLREQFGDEWLYRNQNNNWAIDRRILKALGPLKTDNVIWDRSDQSWRIVDDDDLARIRERDEVRKQRREEARRRRTERQSERESE
ncbi:DUF6953 family protein [Microbacterium sp. MMO-10]|uniref:DUF6953 family protein n=1 Tax=Microbacterium sp. MMO-10 TaxID=3081272 RepID=UPI0030181CFF